MVLDDVDLLAAQFANDRLHAHALHADAGSDCVHLFVFGQDCDLGALSSFARSCADHHRAVVNLRNFGLEQVLHKFRRGTRNHDTRAFRGFLDARDNHTNALADCE